MTAPDADPAHDSSFVLTERFYGELREIARRAFADERRGHTLQPTAAVNEACLRILSGAPLPDVPRVERLALAARVLRQVLIDHHRRRSAEKRGGAQLRVELADDVTAKGTEVADLEALHDALERLRALSPRQAEVVTLRAFGGLGMEDIARALQVSRRTVEADWTVARSWLRRELARAHGGEA